MGNDRDEAASVPAPRTPTTSSSFSPSKVAQAALIVVAIVGLVWVAIELTRFFMLVFAAIVLAAIFDAIAGWLRRYTGMKRSVALAVAVIGMIALFIGVFVLFGSQLAREFDTIRELAPRAIQGFESFLDRYGLGDRARGLIAVGGNDISQLASRAGGYALAAGSGLADFVLVIVAAIFLASDPATYRRGLLLLIPSRAEATVALSLDDAAKGLHGWMVGQFISSLVVAGLTWAGLALLGVPAAGGLGLIAGLLDIIPMLGPIIAGVPAVLLAFTVSPTTALWTVLLFLGIQQLQGNFLQPMIQKHAVDVPPAVLLFAVFASGLLFGFLGVLLAAPLTIVSYVLIRRIYVGTLLGKPINLPSANAGTPGDRGRSGKGIS